MKYLYFDTFSEINLSMILGAFIDMTSCEEKVKKIIDTYLLPVDLYTKDTFISSMEAKRASLIYKGDEGEISKDEILHLPFLDSADRCTKERFEKFIDTLFTITKNDTFKKEEYMSDFCTCFVLYKLFSSYKMDNFIVSKLYVSCAYLFDGETFKEYTKKSFADAICAYGFLKEKSDIPYEFTSPLTLSFLISLDASSKSVTLGETLMTGYGAGSKEIKDMINILRLVYAKDSKDNVRFLENFEISDLKDNYYEIGYNKQK